MVATYRPLGSLQEGRWFKLICGASFQHLPAVRNLALVYALAGADCIDIAADPSVIAIVREALEIAHRLILEASDRLTQVESLPWLMVSLNDGEDPHFRKAQFDPNHCPPDCHRPCQAICPTQAIVFQGNGSTGILEDRCYGCGRCLPICPYQRISAESHVVSPETIAPLVLEGIDAVEIHTQPGRFQAFQQLWQTILPWVDRLKLVAISCPDGEGLINYLRSLHELMSPLPCPLIWQADGRPMSGDIGDGTTRATVRLGQKLLAAQLPGYVQLAGGTNRHTVPKLRSLGLLNPNHGSSRNLFPTIDAQAREPLFSAAMPYIAGIAYGSYARSLLLPLLEQLERIELDFMYYSHDLQMASRVPESTGSVGLMTPPTATLPLQLEAFPDLLWQGVEIAHDLVSQIKFL